MSELKQEIEQTKKMNKELKEEIEQEKERREELLSKLDFKGKTYHPFFHWIESCTSDYYHKFKFNKQYITFLKNNNVNIKIIKKIIIRGRCTSSDYKYNIINSHKFIEGYTKKQWLEFSKTIKKVIYLQDKYCLVKLKDEFCRLTKDRSKLLDIENNLKENTFICPDCGKQDEYRDKKMKFCSYCGFKLMKNTKNEKLQKLGEIKKVKRSRHKFPDNYLDHYMNPEGEEHVIYANTPEGESYMMRHGIEFDKDFLYK